MPEHDDLAGEATIDDQDCWRQLAIDLVGAEIQETLTAAPPAAPAHSTYEAIYRQVVDTGTPTISGVLIELVDLIGGTLIRLAQCRNEDPRETLAWITSTE